MEAMNKLKEEKQAVVLEAIAAKCNDATSTISLLPPIMKEIGTALRNGAELKATILTGGLTNFTYMIYTDSQDLKLFAKLSFPYTHAMQDNPCPLTRADSEFAMMKLFQELAPGCVAVPYFCLDIHEAAEHGDTLKLLVAEWVASKEQFGNQFIDGAVDPRTAISLAKSLAALHCSQKVKIDFNEEIRPFVSSIDPIIKVVLGGYIAAHPAPDRVAKVAQEVITQAKLDEAFANYQSRVNERGHIVHGDFHVFNIMVGAKPSPETLERFPPEGNVVVCDWELSHVGPAGRDLGPFQAFPYSCIFAHEINGDSQCADNISNFLDNLWKEYDAQLFAHGKSDEDVRHAYRDALVFCGLYMIAYSALGIHVNFLPIESTTTNTTDVLLAKVKESIGVMGLKVFVLGCGGDTANLSLKDLRSKVKAAVDEEVELLGQGTDHNPNRRKRRSSVLRSSGVRVSDGHIHITGLDREAFVALANLADSGAEPGHTDDEE